MKCYFLANIPNVNAHHRAASAKAMAAAAIECFVNKELPQ